jgi:hypothetical protein
MAQSLSKLTALLPITPQAGNQDRNSISFQLNCIIPTRECQHNILSCHWYMEVQLDLLKTTMYTFRWLESLTLLPGGEEQRKNRDPDLSLNGSTQKLYV